MPWFVAFVVITHYFILVHLPVIKRNCSQTEKKTKQNKTYCAIDDHFVFITNDIWINNCKKANTIEKWKDHTKLKRLTPNWWLRIFEFLLQFYKRKTVFGLRSIFLILPSKCDPIRPFSVGTFSIRHTGFPVENRENWQNLSKYI